MRFAFRNSVSNLIFRKRQKIQRSSIISKYTFRRLLWLSLFCLMSLKGFANEKPKLLVVGEEWVDMTHPDGTGTYWDIINAVYGNDYDITIQTMSWARAFNLVKKKRADILMGVPPSKYDFFHLPQQHIDTEHPVYLLYDNTKHQINDIEDLANLTIAGRDSYGFEYHLPKSTTFYGVADINNINKLIMNGRIDGALVYAYNSYLADPSKTLAQIEMLPKEKLYIGIIKNEKGEQLRDHFDKQMKKLINEGRIASLFPSAKAYFFADFQGEESSPSATKLLMVPRVFKQNSTALETLPFDDSLALHLLTQEQQHEFKLQINSFSAANELLNQAHPACMINASKRKDRESYLWFSDPIYAYVAPKIISLKSNKQALNNFIDEYGQLNLSKAISSHMRIAVNSNQYTLKLLKSKLPPNLYSKLIQFDALEKRANALENLVLGKVDALIAFPAMVSNSLPEDYSANLLTSFPLENELSTLSYGYFVCNKVSGNERIIETVNRIISEQQQDPVLFKPVLNSLDPESRQDFAKALKLKLN